MKNKTVRSPGRPAKFVGPVLKAILKEIRNSGGNLSHARQALVANGVAISLPTIGKVAHANKVGVNGRGRPVQEAA